jgi:hypothetical protein
MKKMQTKCKPYKILKKKSRQNNSIHKYNKIIRKAKNSKILHIKKTLKND